MLLWREGNKMADLTNHSNIFADLAQSAYTGRNHGENFPSKSNQGKSVEFDFGPGGKAYLQPDSTLKITDKTISTTIPKANGGYETQQHKTGEIAKGLLTDSEAGYNSYFVTDNPSVKDSKETYFVIRGSDAISLKTLNDWVNNNANFTLFNAYIPQAKLAEKQWRQCEETVIYF